MTLKKYVLSFLRKLVRDEISSMWDGCAFQARGPAMGNALSVTWSLVRDTTKLPCTLDRSRVSSQRRTSSDRYCGAVPWLMSNIKVHSLNWISLDTGSQWSCFRRGGACVRTEAPQRSLAAASCTRCRQYSVDWAACKQTYNNPCVTVLVYLSAYRGLQCQCVYSQHRPTVRCVVVMALTDLAHSLQVRLV